MSRGCVASGTVRSLLKGVLHPDEARRAVAEGIDGIVVSNHGGRQLDGAPATIDALPAIVAAVAGRIPVLVDGGVRRGADIARALSLGATACLIGRPHLWGLAVAGEAGVAAVLDLYRRELDRVMALCGWDAVSAIAEAAPREPKRKPSKAAPRVDGGIVMATDAHIVE